MRGFLDRLFGGSVLGTLLKLLVLSVLIGALLTAFGFTPSTLPRRVMAGLRSLAQLGIGSVRDVGSVVLTGAIVVVPVWLAIRLLSGRR